MGSRLLTSESVMCHVERRHESTTDSRAELALVIHCTAARARTPTLTLAHTQHDRLTGKRANHQPRDTDSLAGERLRMPAERMQTNVNGGGVQATKVHERPQLHNQPELCSLQPAAATNHPLNSLLCLRGPICLPLSGFTHCFTLSSKFFSIFHHCTCSLSDSWSYLAFDGVYHRLHLVLANKATLW